MPQERTRVVRREVTVRELRCSECGKWYEPKRRYPTHLYCGNRCKNRAYRRRLAREKSTPAD